MRTTIGKASLEINDANVDSFRKLVTLLVEQYPETAFHLVDAHGDLRPDIPVYVDGRNPRLMAEGINAPLQPGSVISFFSPISSGKMNVEVLRD
jgi:hypothetical protein